MWIYLLVVIEAGFSRFVWIVYAGYSMEGEHFENDKIVRIAPFQIINVIIL